MDRFRACLEIYRRSFPAEKEFKNNLFRLCKNCLKTLEINGVTVSMLFALPCEVLYKNGSFKAEYIFAAATHPHYRNKGYMGKLLSHCKKTREGLILLRPASERLSQYYEKYGFKEFRAQDRENNGLSVLPTGAFRELCLMTEKTQEGDFPVMEYGSLVSMENLYFPFTMP